MGEKSFAAWALSNLQVAQEQAERRATAKQMFELGQKAYGRGMYGRSIEFLEAALTAWLVYIRPSSLLGGEVIYPDPWLVYVYVFEVCVCILV